MSKKICTFCIGTGTVRGMGWISESCRNCDGKGHHIHEEESKVSEEVSGKTEVKIRKKRTVKKESE